MEKRVFVSPFADLEKFCKKKKDKASLTVFGPALSQKIGRPYLLIYPDLIAPIFLDRDCLLKTHFCIGLHYAWRDDPQLLIQVGGAHGLPRTPSNPGSSCSRYAATGAQLYIWKSVFFIQRSSGQALGPQIWAITSRHLYEGLCQIGGLRSDA